MKTKLTHLLAISSLLILGSCATSNQTAQQVDQNDDVYYSVAKAKEEVQVIAQAQPQEARKSDYVTDDELYRDAYGNDGDYAQRIYRFRNYTPWRGYYNNGYGSMYGYGNVYNGYGNMYSSYYDPYYSPFNSYGSGIILAVGINGGYYNYNPWRYYGHNYNSNFWGPYSYYNPYGLGFGGYGNNGFYGGGYGVNRPVYTSPNYRPRPVRGSDGLPIDPGAVNGGNAGGIIRNGNNGNVIQSGGSRAGRYDGGTSTAPSSGNSRPAATAPRPERVSQQPQRSSQPERVNSAPPSNNNSGGGRSNDGGSSGGGGRPSRGN
ncbi:MAG: hypothetical protein V4721_09570 [Bacteroidota bacterium]